MTNHLPLLVAGGCLLCASTALYAQGTCQTLSENFDLTVPCVSYEDNNYQLDLQLASDDEPYIWQLDELSITSDTGICGTVNSTLTIDLPCVIYSGDYYQATFEVDSSAIAQERFQWNIASAKLLESEPILYIVSMMHVEDHIDFHLNQPLFDAFSSKLLSVSNLLSSHGGKIDFGPDWPFLRGAISFDLTLMPGLLAAGHGVHTHAHETKFDAGSGLLYDLALVNDLLAKAGAPGNQVANGGFDKEGINGGNWARYVAAFKTLENQSRFSIAVGYKDLATQAPSNLRFIIQPSQEGENWQANSKSSSLLYAPSNMPVVTKGGVLDFDTIRTQIDSVLSNLIPGQINTLYWHDSLHNYTNDQEAIARLKAWELFLVEYLDPLIASGKVQWKTFTEMGELYRQSLMVIHE